MAQELVQKAGVPYKDQVGEPTANGRAARAKPLKLALAALSFGILPEAPGETRSQDRGVAEAEGEPRTYSWSRLTFELSGRRRVGAWPARWMMT